MTVPAEHGGEHPSGSFASPEVTLEDRDDHLMLWLRFGETRMRVNKFDDSEPYAEAFEFPDGSISIEGEDGFSPPLSALDVPDSWHDLVATAVLEHHLGKPSADSATDS